MRFERASDAARALPLPETRTNLTRPPRVLEVIGSLARCSSCTDALRLCAAFLSALCASAAARAQDAPTSKDVDAPKSEQRQSSDADEPRHFEPVFSRWLAPGYTPPGIDLEGYEINETARPWNPYHQNVLKGDFPIAGTEDLFLDLSATLRQTIVSSRLPVGTGGTGSAQSFFGNGHVRAYITQLSTTLDLFRAPQAFEPVEWRVKITPVFQRSEVDVNEPGVIDVDPSRGKRRIDHDFALQEALVEYHIANISPYYDFISVEAGILPFRSDFRGFVFDDTNLGTRFSGNWDHNLWQYNIVFFDMLDKDTNSGLNEFDERDQQVLIANVYHQDWPVDGYTTELSFHYNNDHRGVHFDDNGGLVSPAPVGLARENKVESYYFGLAGEGHFGRFNVTDAFYQATGRDSDNPFAGRRVQIDAQLAALEVSYDMDWWRIRGFGFYTSGDDQTRDGKAHGFDAILDAPNFAGGGFSFFNSQALRLLGVNLTNAGSPIPDLQSSQTEGHSNFVNPGIQILGGALDFDFTPKLRGQIGASHLRFNETDVLETYLELPQVDRTIGNEFFLGVQYRPLLTNNVIFVFGASALVPGAGFQEIYQSSDNVYSGFTNLLFSF